MGEQWEKKRNNHENIKFKFDIKTFHFGIDARKNKQTKEMCRDFLKLSSRF